MENGHVHGHGCAPGTAGKSCDGDALTLGLVEVRHTGGTKGWGLFATTCLEENTWVGDYLGQACAVHAAWHLARE